MIDIIPQGTSAVVTTGDKDHDGDRYRNHDRFAQVSRDIKDGVSTTVNASTTGFTAAALAACHTNDRICDSTGKVIGAVTHGTEESQENYAALSKQMGDNYAAMLIDAAKNAAATQVQLEKTSGDLTNQAQNNFNQAAVQATNFANLASVQSQNYANLASVQATSNFNALTLQAVTNANAVALQNQTIASAAVLEAQKNQSATVLLMTQLAAQQAAAQAECCCELKALTILEANKTRELIESNEKSNLRDKNHFLQTQLAAYYSAKAPPVMP